MPPLPGEERLATVFCDLHIYFAQPTTRPVLHRFDKASYFYFLYNSTRQTSRIEVANNPGTTEQDAFNGYLEDCRIVNSHKFPTLVTIVVDASGATLPSSATSRSSRSPQEWRLASADPRDQGKQMYKIHTLDIYFWTAEDAKLVTDLFKKLLPPSQLDIVEAQEPASQRHDDMSPVVQNLENVAISDPAYRNGQTRNSRLQSQTQAAQVPSPPMPQAGATSSSPVSQMSSVGGGSVKPQEPLANFTPMAYNPAAPPAPEPIAYREKTPPPVDAAEGTGLSAAALHDAPYQPGVPQSAPYTGVPGPVPSAFGHFGSPPPPPPSTYGSSPPVRTSISSATPSFGAPPTQATSLTGRRSSTAQQYAPHPTDPTTQAFGGHAQPVETPGAQFYGSLAQDQRHQPLTHVQPQYPDYLSSRPQPPVGGYSQYQYDQQQPAPPQQQQQQHLSAYDVHSQVYRPTESEVNKHSHRPSSSSQKPSKFDQGAERVEKGLNKYLKKLEKKIG